MLSQFRPSVRLSVTRVDQSKTVEVRVVQFSAYSSPIPLLFAVQVSSGNSDGIPPSGSVKREWVGKRANIVGVLTLSPGGSTSLTVRIAADESKFTVNRQVAALSRAKPGVSSAFLFSPST